VTNLPTSNAYVAIVDDDAAIRTALGRALRMENYDVELFEDGLSALKAVQLRAPDAIVLDLQLPDIDGLEVCRRIRRAGDATPILMLTARDAVNDRVEGLDVGADDYLVKPFDLAELLARLRALLRRRQVTDGDDTVLRFEDLTLNPGTREVRRGDRVIELTKIEFDLLELFLQHPRQVLTAIRFSTSCGLHLRLGYQLTRGLHRLLAPQARRSRRGTPHPDSPRRGIRAAHCMTFRSRVIAATVIAAALAVVLASLASFLTSRNALTHSVDESLLQAYQHGDDNFGGRPPSSFSPVAQRAPPTPPPRSSTPPSSPTPRDCKRATPFAPSSSTIKPGANSSSPCPPERWWPAATVTSPSPPPPPTSISSPSRAKSVSSVAWSAP